MPVECFRSREMAVSAPQFLIGAKFRPAEEGKALLRQRLVSQLALRMLVGASSPFYARLYSQGLISHDFDYEADFTAGTATVIIGGESREPEKVLEELKAEAARVSEKGFDAELFRRSKRASLGARLRGLEDFESVCVSTVTGLFSGYCAFDAISLLGQVTKDECEQFVRETLSSERLAITIITPKRT